MNVGEIMTKNVVSVGPDTPFKEVVERLVRSEVSSLPVVDRTGALVGLISEADLIPMNAYAHVGMGMTAECAKEILAGPLVNGMACVPPRR